MRGAGKVTKRGIRFKIAIFICSFVIVLMAVDALWNIELQQRQARNEAQEKAEVLAEEMRAVWDFVDLNQDAINRNEDGTFRNKALVCVVAAKAVSMLFTLNTDYTIRFASETPRQKVDAPDPFEAKAFEAFRSNPDPTAYYGVEVQPDGSRVFRYVEPLYVTESCLECHGEPAGELDQYGYEKEGMVLGQIGGAMSIIEPMEIYDAGIQASVAQQVFMVLLMLALACVGIYTVASRLILRPLDNIRKAARKIGNGDFDYDLHIRQIGGSDELTEFAADFDKMAGQLRRLYSDLESEVEKQTNDMRVLNEMLNYQKAELKKVVDKLSEETAYKNEFFAITSHELRTPLTSILAFSRMLKEQDDLSAKTRSSVEEIEANATLLLNMVNNILVISKVEAQRIELILEPVDMVDLLGFVRKSLDPVARNKQITLSAKTDSNVPLTMADWEKLRRVLENLVDNSIKYTHHGGYVRIRASFENTESDAMRDIAESDGDSGLTGPVIAIAVEDDGIGMDEADLDVIFDLYKQVGKSANRRYRGTGLGLAVVKELTELHGGRVSVVSHRKQGSTFTVRIPYVAVDTEDYDEDNACG